MADSDVLFIITFGNGVNVNPTITATTVGLVNAAQAAGTPLFDPSQQVEAAGSSSLLLMDAAGENKVIVIKGADEIMKPTNWTAE